MSRERVLDAAIALADRGGIGALSMRKLAQALGVEAMTLYYHVANKEAILDGIVDMVVSEVELPPADAGWKAAIRRSAISAHDVLQRHPWAAGLMLAPNRVSQARLRHMDAVLGTLRRAGFSAEMTDHAYHALDSHIMGFTLWVVGMNIGADGELEAMAADFLATLDRDELPHLAEHVEQHLRPRRPNDEDDFAFGLDLILDGLERTLRPGESAGA
ncbi:MAG: TetR/AcrR family transcriptional regulator C-terminal domain-containing protein [Candidatus Limnocylindria bacterium]